jgi:heme exporter protein C
MSILTPLLVMTLAFTLLFVALQLLSMQVEVRRRRLATMERRRAYAAGSPN